jgi:hypothetical protein
VRSMNIPPFERKIEIGDFDFFVRSRLAQAIVIWPEQAIPLLGYMAWPNQPERRAELAATLQGWSEGSRVIPPGLRQMQTDWVRVADIFNLHYDLTAGDHQRRRGGPSIGKAVSVAAARIRARGARPANLWRAWEAYKDVAHLLTAATIISADARERAKTKPIGEAGPLSSHLQPFHITMLMPDFVLSLALSLQEYGLKNIPQSREQPMLDPETLWRVPPNMNVAALAPPVRKMDSNSIAVLHARRAGNRGKANRRKTTPVLGRSFRPAPKNS